MPSWVYTTFSENQLAGLKVERWDSSLYGEFINLLSLIHQLALAYRTTPLYQYIHVISEFPQEW
jgi:hypothetical protein